MKLKKKKKKKKKRNSYSGDICTLMKPYILVVVGEGGGAVENVCGRHLKYGYNVCEICWVLQSKMVSKCNRIASLVIFNYKIFMGEIPKTPLTRRGRPPLVLSPTRAFGTRWPSTAFNGRTTFKNPTTALQTIYNMDLILFLKLVRDDALRIGIRIKFHSLGDVYEYHLLNKEEGDLGTANAALTDDHSVRLWVLATGFSKSVIYWGVKLFIALYIKTALLYLIRFTIGSQINSSTFPLTEYWNLHVILFRYKLIPYLEFLRRGQNINYWIIWALYDNHLLDFCAYTQILNRNVEDIVYMRRNSL